MEERRGKAVLGEERCNPGHGRMGVKYNPGHGKNGCKVLGQEVQSRAQQDGCKAQGTAGSLQPCAPQRSPSSLCPGMCPVSPARRSPAASSIHLLTEPRDAQPHQVAPA